MPKGGCGRFSASWLWLSILVVLLDQGSKYWVGQYLVLFESIAVLPGLNLSLHYNTGAAFSFLSQAGGWQRWFFIAVTSVVSIGIVIGLCRLPGRQTYLAVALALILGGALGNLIDRIILGYVIDFIEIYYGRWSWPVFNLADSAITIGAGLLVFDILYPTYPPKKDR